MWDILPLCNKDRLLELQRRKRGERKLSWMSASSSSVSLAVSQRVLPQRQEATTHQSDARLECMRLVALGHDLLRQLCKCALNRAQRAALFLTRLVRSRTARKGSWWPRRRRRRCGADRRRSRRGCQVIWRAPRCFHCFRPQIVQWPQTDRDDRRTHRMAPASVTLRWGLW